MAASWAGNWAPTRLLRLTGKPWATSTGAARVKTDATYGVLKALGNNEGPHALAREWVGTALARWFGLQVPDFAIIHLTEFDTYELPDKKMTQPGPAFVSRWVPGKTWDLDSTDADNLVNPADVTRLVVFDTWIRNRDRHPPPELNRGPNYRNVYLADVPDGAGRVLYAIDHTHCFDTGDTLTAKIAAIDNWQDPKTYGLFPEFVPLLDRSQLMWCQATLSSLPRETVREIVESIPSAWDVPAAAKAALVELIFRRADFLCHRIEDGWRPGE